MGHPIHKHMGGMKSAERFDAKEAYNKKLSSKARMHYLENDIADKKGMSRHTSEHSTEEYMDRKDAAIKKAKGMSRKSSPANNVTYGDKSGKTGYIGGMSRESATQERKNLNTINPVDDKAGISRYKKDY